MPKASADKSVYLDEHGCAFGQVNRERVEKLGEDVTYIRGRVDAMDGKLWGMLIAAGLQLLGLVGYLLTHPGTVAAFWQR